MKHLPLFAIVTALALTWTAPIASSAARAGSVDGSAFLGVEMERADRGVFISRVVRETAAEHAGLKVEDLILGISGTATDSSDDVREILGRHSAGDSVQVVLRRADEILVIDVTLGERPASEGRPRAARLGSVLAVLRAAPGQVVADIGCGRGWLAMGVAEVVGTEGRVYAVEIDRGHVRRMEERGIANIEAVHSKRDDVSLPAKVLDLAVLHDVASHVKKSGRPAFYASIARALKEDGRLVIFGPHGRAREMLDELVKYGFRPENEARFEDLSKTELNDALDAGIRFVFGAAEAPGEE